MPDVAGRSQYEAYLQNELERIFVEPRAQAAAGEEPDWSQTRKRVRDSLLAALLLLFGITVSRWSALVRTINTGALTDTAQDYAQTRSASVADFMLGNMQDELTALLAARGQAVGTDSPMTDEEYEAGLDAIFGRLRTERVASTEVTATASEAELASSRQYTEETGEYLLAGWNTERDARVCPICAPLDGQVEDLEETEGQTWRREFPDGPPAHVGCRCFLVYAQKDDSDFIESLLLEYDPNQPRDPAGSETGGQWTGGGARMRTFYHATSKASAASLEAEGISKESLNQRDSGFFGPGFYSSREPQDFYGKHLVAITLKTDAKILEVGGLAPDAPQAWHSDFVKSLERRIRKHRPHFESKKLAAIVAEVTPGNPAFSHTLYRQEISAYARSESFDAVAFADGQETVILNVHSIESIKRVGSKAAAARHRSMLETADCGANAPGGGGFQAGNDCAKGSGAGRSKQTTTAAFKKWFGDSKVVDEDGEPLVVYHGTGDIITQFDLEHPNRKDTGWLGTGVYVTTDPNLAGSYSNLKPGYQNVMPLYAKVENPYFATSADKQRLQLISHSNGKDAGRAAADAWTRELISKGHDGIILEYKASEVGKSNASKEIVVFSTKGVKSATGNRGTWNPDSANITESDANV